MSVILFALPPEIGHILPTVPIARRLASYGHQVIYFTARTFAPLLQRLGFLTEPLVAEPLGQCNSPDKTGWSFWYQFESAHAPLSRGASLAKVLRPVLQRHSVDLLVADFLFVNSYRVPLHSILNDTPCVLVSSTLLNWDEAVDPKHYPLLVLCPGELEVPRFRNRHPQVCYAEPSLYLDNGEIFRGDDVSQLCRQDKKLVLASFGTQSIRARDFEHKCEALAETARARPDIDLILALGDGSARKALLNKWPDIPNLKVCGTTLQWHLLKKMSAFITHGGLGSVKEALLQGVPMVVLPTGFDQPFNALRVQYHKLGEYLLPESVAAETLGAALDRVLANGNGPARADFSALMRERDQHPIAADFISDRLRSRV
jgi:UDP:flavonoid glycosyltransferase YjiC (YdhE family)